MGMITRNLFITHADMVYSLTVGALLFSDIMERGVSLDALQSHLTKAVGRTLPVSGLVILVASVRHYSPGVEASRVLHGVDLRPEVHSAAGITRMALALPKKPSDTVVHSSDVVEEVILPQHSEFVKPRRSSTY